jgi:uncharacterized protein
VVSSSQSLCLKCGLCCDGTFLSGVPLKPNDETAPLKAAGIKIVSDNDLTVFKLPCAALRNCACTVYANRPQRCRTYKCELLKRFERDDISQQSAVEIIDKVKSLKNQMNALAFAASTTAQSGEEIILLLKKCQTDANIGTRKQDYAHVLLKFGELQIYLDRFFREEPTFTIATLDRSTAAPCQDSSTGAIKALCPYGPNDAARDEKPEVS